MVEKKSMLCPHCRKLISPDEPACPYCGTARPGALETGHRGLFFPFSARSGQSDHRVNAAFYSFRS